MECNIVVVQIRQEGCDLSWWDGEKMEVTALGDPLDLGKREWEESIITPRFLPGAIM